MATKILPVRGAIITAGVLLVGASALAACGGDGDAAVGTGEGRTDSSKETLATAVASTPLVGQRIRTLIAPRDVSFSVAFTSDNLYFNGPEYLFWRQAKGMVRWDIVLSRSEEPDMGWISVVSDTPPEGSLPYTSMGCLWFLQGSSQSDGTPQARLSCSEGGSAPGVLFDAMASRITEQLSDETVGGRRASCYSFDDPEMTVGRFCVDSSQGIPLLLSTVGRRDSRLTQEIRAISVSTAEENVDFPVELQEHPVLHDWYFEGTVPISRLQLPVFGQFRE